MSLCIFKRVLKWPAREDALSHWLHLFDLSPLCVFKCLFKSHAMFCSSKYIKFYDQIHWPCPQHSPRAHIKPKEFIKKNSWGGQS